MKKTFTTSLRDRTYLTPLILSALLVIVLLVLGASNIRVSELQVPVRYSSFGITNFYREQWFYQLAFVIFGVIVFGLNTALGVKLAKTKGREYAVFFQWVSVLLLTISVLTVAAIFHVAELV